jgi:hypothetical protein
VLPKSFSSVKVGRAVLCAPQNVGKVVKICSILISFRRARSARPTGAPFRQCARIESLIYLERPRKTQTRYLVSYIETVFGTSSN